ncbi:hypothetical protein Tco_1178680, partial [Tanacetum coccineum]
DIDYLTDSMNYIPVSLENQANPHAGTLQTPNSNASEEKDEDVELIVVPSAVKNTEEKVESRTSSTNSKKEEILTEPQQEKKASSTDTSEDNTKILAYRRELEEIALKHLGTVSENNSTSTPSVNTGNESVNTGRFNPDDSPMPELEIFHSMRQDFLMRHLLIEEGVIMTSTAYTTEIKVGPTLSLISQYSAQMSNTWDPKVAVAYLESRGTIKKISEALQDDSLVQPMQEELLQFKLQQVWVLVDLPQGMKVTPKTSHLNTVKRIFKYLKGKPNLGLWYLRESPFDLEAFSDSDYDGSNLDRKSITGIACFEDVKGFEELVDFLEVPTSEQEGSFVDSEEEEQWASGESIQSLEAVAILTKVKKIKLVDKGKRYKRRKSSKESAGTSLDFEEVKSAFEEFNTGGIKVSTGIKEINAGSLDVNIGSDLVTTDSIRVSVPSPDRGRREGKAPMT